MILQLALSCFVAWASLGYWSTGIETVLPSLNLTLSAFLEASTQTTFGVFREGPILSTLPLSPSSLKLPDKYEK